MVKIGLLSDTHAWWDDRYAKYFAECDEIWHAGDIGSVELADRFEALKPFRAVYGNIDGHELRLRYPQHQRFTIEGVDVWMTHIGGYPGKYAREVIPQIYIHKTLKCLHINPGAAGLYGFHKKRTLVRFVIDGAEIKDLEIIELADRRQGG